MPQTREEYESGVREKLKDLRNMNARELKELYDEEYEPRRTHRPRRLREEDDDE